MVWDVGCRHQLSQNMSISEVQKQQGGEAGLQGLTVYAALFRRVRAWGVFERLADREVSKISAW